MREILYSFGRFLLAVVWRIWTNLMGGAVALVCYWYYRWHEKEVPMKAYYIIAGATLFVSCFWAWREQEKIAKAATNKKRTPEEQRARDNLSDLMTELLDQKELIQKLKSIGYLRDKERLDAKTKEIVGRIFAALKADYSVEKANLFLNESRLYWLDRSTSIISRKPFARAVNNLNKKALWLRAFLGRE